VTRPMDGRRVDGGRLNHEGRAARRNAVDLLVWAWIGAAVAAVGALVALAAARPAARSFYASEVYGMNARSHMRFAALSALFVAAFIADTQTPALPAVPLLAVYVLLLVLYGASFARGSSEP
jgi:hypothetical protein